MNSVLPPADFQVMLDVSKTNYPCGPCYSFGAMLLSTGFYWHVFQFHQLQFLENLLKRNIDLSLSFFEPRNTFVCKLAAAFFGIAFFLNKDV